jgi:hypothetical protein
VGDGTLARKLGIRRDMRVAVVGAPKGYPRALGSLPDGVHVRTHARGTVDLLMFFVTRRAELARRFPSFTRALDREGVLWIAWPKKNSGVATDLAFALVQHIGADCTMVDTKVCSIDDNWTAVRFESPAQARLRMARKASAVAAAAGHDVLSARPIPIRRPRTIRRVSGS